MAKALVTRIIRHGGKDCRLRAGRVIPELPAALEKLLVRTGYLERPPRPPRAERIEKFKEEE